MRVLVLAELPSFLHDASLLGLHLDYEREETRLVVRLRVHIWDEATESTDHRVGLLTFDRVGHVAIDPPGRRLFLEMQTLEAQYALGQPAYSPCPAMDLGPEYTLHTFYLADSNSHLRIAAKNCSFDWE